MIFKIINTNKDKIRLDQFLSEKLNLSRTKVQNLIANKKVTVNQQIPKKNGLLLEDNDEVKVDSWTNEIFNNPSEIETFNYNLDIVYEDDDILVVNKPSGLLSHPTIHQEKDTLTNAIAHHFKKQNINLNLIRSGVAHRLDKDTSGLVLVAKNEKALSQILQDFANKKIVKKYYAIVLNQLPKNHLMINLPIGRSNDGSIKMIVNGNKDLKSAQTEVFQVEKLHEHSLVNCILHTGRTHQIRVHLAAIKCPVLNDYLYGNEIKGDLFGQYLHAYYLSFNHPITKKLMEFNCDFPKEFAKKLEELRYNKI